jgi:ABC-2 type transport system permease protein
MFVFSYQQAMLGDAYTQIGGSSTSVIIMGFESVTSMMAWFSPLLGIALSFDAIVKEQKSGSLNVLLTHPVFRDNIILGKLLGSMLTLIVVILVSSTVSIGTLVIVVGEAVNGMELIRILISLVITYIYTLTFMGIGLILSTSIKDATSSLIYNVLIWICSTVVFSVIITSLLLLCDQDITADPSGEALFTSVSNLSPMYHYAKITSGVMNLGFGGPGTASTIQGIFDVRYTISQWFDMFWINIVTLVITPFILFVIAFLTFLRKDINL